MVEQEERLSGALQENILVALCFDKDYCRIIRSAVKPQLFESKMFREVAGHAMDFLDQFGEPIAEHLPDYLEDVLKGEDSRKADMYERLLKQLFASQAAVNGQYVVSQLTKFVRAQHMKSAVSEAAEALLNGEVDKAEIAFHKALKAQVVTFDAGVRFHDPVEATAFMESDEKPYLTGIDALDKYGVGPARKTLMLVIAPTNRGKTWWMIHLGKHLIQQGLCVVHITLEMSAKKCAGRYAQSFFSLNKRQGLARVPRLMKNADGGVVDIEFDQLEVPSLQDDGAQALIAKKVKNYFSSKPPLIIKEFPTRALSMTALEGYLDNLERFEKIVPDAVILDYVDLMEVDSKQLRESIGNLTAGFRGLCVARNMCGITASQTNRGGINAKVIDETDLSEDISKGFTCDVSVTYNQTQAEHALQIARLYCNKNRDEEAKMMALVTQAYGIGQFCLESSPVVSNYWKMVAGAGDEEEGDN